MPRAELTETFAGTDLDREVWLPHYLPHWSSRAGSAATYSVRDGELRLWIPPEQPLWCPDLHDEPIRVSGIQSGLWAGPVGSTRGQSPVRPEAVVREAQEPFAGYTPHFGRIEIRMRGTISARSMVAFWLIGLEDERDRSGEICVAEIFGAGVKGGSAEVGMGIHAFRDAALVEQWATERLTLDPAAFHTYGVDWRPGSVELEVDGAAVRRLDQAPDYPMQLMIAVFDFPGRAVDGADEPTPELVVSDVRGRQLD